MLRFLPVQMNKSHLDITFEAGLTNRECARKPKTNSRLFHSLGAGTVNI